MITNRLDTVRKEAGLSKKDFALKLKITPQSYNNYYKGLREIPTDLAININQLFNVSLDWLLIGKGEMYFQDNSSQNIIGNNNITTGGTINGNISINTNKFSHKNDVMEIIELLEYAPSGFLSIIKEKLLAFRKLSEF